MQGAVKERWRELCEQAAIEQNPTRLMKLVEEITWLLQEKQERLNKRSRPQGTTPEADQATSPQP